MSSAPLPRGWKRHIKSSLLHAISLATVALTIARSRGATHGLRAELERATNESALVQISEPVNRFPDFVRYLVRQLKALCQTMGKVRIAQVLARAGLHLGATSVGRILKETEPVPGRFLEAVLPRQRYSPPVRCCWQAWEHCHRRAVHPCAER